MNINFAHTALTKDQKLAVMKAKYYDGLIWSPKKGDYYTSCRNDLELYQIVDEDESYFYTNYCDLTRTTEQPSKWLRDQFLKDFGEKRVYVPEFIFDAYPAIDSKSSVFTRPSRNI